MNFLMFKLVLEKAEEDGWMVLEAEMV